MLQAKLDLVFFCYCSYRLNERYADMFSFFVVQFSEH